MRPLAFLATLVVAAAVRSADPPRPADADLELNLRWMLDRARAAKPDAAAARVGVWADAGVWHVGARSVVAALETERTTCRVLDKTRLTTDGLKGLNAVILPGGWAPHQWEAAGEKGLAAIRTFVEGAAGASASAPGPTCFPRR